MPEDRNAELAQELSRRFAPRRERWEDITEVIEAIALGLVAVATAWSGYQAARWDGRQAFLYGRATTISVTADERLSLGGQQRLLDVSTVNT